MIFCYFSQKKHFFRKKSHKKKRKLASKFFPCQSNYFHSHNRSCLLKLNKRFNHHDKNLEFYEKYKLNVENGELLEEAKQFFGFRDELVGICGKIEDDKKNSKLVKSGKSSNMTNPLNSIMNPRILQPCDILYDSESSYDYFEINLGYAELLKYTRTEVPIDTWDRLFIDLSGTLGFWMGFSFITLFEIFVFLYRLIFVAICSLFEKDRDLNESLDLVK